MTVGSAALLGGALLITHQHRVRAAALVGGTALAWISSWIVKSVIERARPPDPVVRTTGQTYPSAHAANSVGWLVLAITLTVVIPSLAGKIAVISAGALMAVIVGVSRVYLRAHYASDVLAGEALAVAMYALVTIGAIALET